MTYNIKYYLFVVCLALTLTSSLTAQSIDNSPFSRLGIGDITNPNLNGVALMGNLGSSFISSTELNVVNPASYGFLDYTVFDVGIYGKYSVLSDAADQTAEVKTGNLEYISLGFPLRNINNEIFDRVNKPYKWGMNFTVKPFSTVNYNIKTTTDFEPVGDITREYEGYGGTYSFKWGTGYRYKDFGIGANFGYLFGNINNEQYIDVVYDFTELKDEIINEYSIRGLLWDIGMIYRLTLNKDEIQKVASAQPKKLIFGARFSGPTHFNTKRNYSHIGDGSDIRLTDTLAYVADEEGTGKLPATIGGGVTYEFAKNTSIGIDISTAFWNNYTNDARPEQDLNQSTNVSIGGSYLPNKKGFGNFFERSVYKWGLYYQKDPRHFDNTILTNYGVTLGASLPFYYQKSFSKVNVGFDFGRRQVEGLLSENYAILKIGINFNDDQWFLKSRYN